MPAAAATPDTIAYEQTAKRAASNPLLNLQKAMYMNNTTTPATSYSGALLDSVISGTNLAIK